MKSKLVIVLLMLLDLTVPGAAEPQSPELVKIVGQHKLGDLTKINNPFTKDGRCTNYFNIASDGTTTFIAFTFENHEGQFEGAVLSLPIVQLTPADITCPMIAPDYGKDGVRRYIVTLSETDYQAVRKCLANPKIL